MRYDIIMDLARGIPTTTQQLRNHFLPMGQMLVEQFHFYSGPSSTLRFSPQIATANHQPKCRPVGKVILRHFSCALRVSSDKRFGAGSRGVPEPIQPMSLLNLGLWRLPCGIFPPRQVLGYPYCGIFAICASAFGGISTLCEGCRKGGVMLPITQEKIVLLNTALFEAL